MNDTTPNTDEKIKNLMSSWQGRFIKYSLHFTEKLTRNIDNSRSKSETQFENCKNEKIEEESIQEMNAHFIQALEYGKMLSDENVHLQQTIRLYEEEVIAHEILLHCSY
jgi:mannose/fructose/N-acetylgalactosamine-specific phosphotransferase system component IIB